MDYRGLQGVGDFSLRNFFQLITLETSSGALNRFKDLKWSYDILEVMTLGTGPTAQAYYSVVQGRDNKLFLETSSKRCPNAS